MSDDEKAVDVTRMMAQLEAGESATKISAALAALKTELGDDAAALENGTFSSPEEADWYEEAVEILSEFGPSITGVKKQFTCLAVVWGDMNGVPRRRAWEDSRCCVADTYYKSWLRDPEYVEIENRVRRLAARSMLDQEVRAIRFATHMIRMASPRAAQTHIRLMRNANPFVALQASRHILNAADRGTAAAVEVNMNMSAGELSRLAAEADRELEQWEPKVDVIEGEVD